MKQIGWIIILSATACMPHAQVTSPEVIASPPAETPNITVADALPAKDPPASPQQQLTLSYNNTTRDDIRMQVVAFDDREFVLQVADQPKGAGSSWTTAQAAAKAKGAVAAINGGFFSPEGKPHGLLIEAGVSRGHLNKSSLGAGIYLSSGARSAIIRREVFEKTRHSWKAHHLLQTGPILVENKKPVAGLSKSKHRPRSFIAWDGKHHWLVGRAEACTLGGLAEALAGRTPGSFEITTAVNLDGGTSSDLWVGTSVPGGGKSHRTIFNKVVRNYMVIIKR